MKYANGIIGLLIGSALGGSVVAATLETPATGGTLDREAIQQIVRDTIRSEPGLIVESVQKWQQDAQSKGLKEVNDKIKDPATRAEILDSPDSPFVGDAGSKRVLAEFFDYNCPACKMQFAELKKLHAKDPSVKIVFKEYPIFGPQSEENSRIGIAVHRLDNDKYFPWHEKMMGNKGRTDAKTAYGYAKELGMDVEALKKEAASKEVAAILEKERALGNKLQLQGTPSIVINDELVPHALEASDIERRLAGKATPE